MDKSQSAATRWRVIIVDDHPMVRIGLTEMLRTQPDFQVCGEAATIASTLQLVAQHHPHLAIIDLALGIDNGLDLVTTLTRHHAALRVLVLSGLDERLHADRALKAGAHGYVRKDQAADELLYALRRVAGGKSYVSEDATERILAGLAPGRRRQVEHSPIDRLSDRERHVLTLVGHGLATREIADQLTLSVKTVETHYSRIKEKLGLKNARELTRVAVFWSDGRFSR